MNEPLPLSEMQVIGHNDYYRFCIAKSGDRWLGFAMPKRSRAEQAFQSEGLEVPPQMMMVLPEVSDGFEMGMLDKDKAILLTGAVAQDVESSYGGIDEWFVPEELRGKPDDFRCQHCERVGCDCRECEPDYREDY